METLVNEFTKYPSIENSYRPEWIERIRNHGLEEEKWLITEKVHGSNTQISFDGTTIRYGTRGHELEEGEACYNVVQAMSLEGIQGKIKEIYLELKSNYSNMDKLILFGEICGGNYPHPDVPRNTKASKVQKGVCYSQDNKWLMFDICIVQGEQKIFLNGKQFIDVTKRYMIQCVPVLFVANNLTEALVYQNNGKSVVGTSIFGLPELEDNIMEGVVIRGYDNDWWTGQHRVIIKNKNDKFAEKSHERKTVKVEEELPEHLVKIIETALQYVTEPRVDNVISHLGEVQLEDIGKVIGLTNKDVIEDFQKETDLFRTIEKNEVKKVTGAINKAVAKLVREVLYRRLTTK